MKRCAHCGSEQGDDAVVCKSCGKSLAASDDGADRVRLYDVLVESLGTPLAREHCARTLLTLKRVPTLEGAYEQLNQLPFTLFSHLTSDGAKQYERLLQVSGVEAKARPSLVVCPYCHFSAELEGKLSDRRDGVFYRCYSCSRKFFLSYRDHASHMLLDCAVCGAQLRLPVHARVGRYKCVCGTMLDYLGGGQVAPPPRAARPAKETMQAVRTAAAAEPVVALHGISRGPGLPWKNYAAVLFLIAAMFILGLSVGEIVSPFMGRRPLSTLTPVTMDPRIMQFTSDTTYDQILGLLGPPRREALSQDGTERLLFYPERDMYIVVGQTGRRPNHYLATLRLSDDRQLHSASPPKPSP